MDQMFLLISKNILKSKKKSRKIAFGSGRFLVDRKLKSEVAVHDIKRPFPKWNWISFFWSIRALIFQASCRAQRVLESKMRHTLCVYLRKSSRGSCWISALMSTLFEIASSKRMGIHVNSQHMQGFLRSHHYTLIRLGSYFLKSRARTQNFLL